MTQKVVTKKKLDKCVKEEYKHNVDNFPPIYERNACVDDEVVTIKKKELIHALTILEGVKRGLRKVLDKHST